MTETITLRHGRAACQSYAKDRASTRRAFIAKCALSAANWLITQKPGLCRAARQRHGMREFLKEA
ncbi:MAG: hypothetical protein IJS28_12715 [Synergistaceae bacterium]|nr:hypothetical protein [Synergistaceae bacterium]